LVGYFFIIKPLDEIEKTVNTKIETYLTNDTKHRLDEAIVNLESEDVIVHFRALKLVESYAPTTLTDEQIFRIIRIIKKAERISPYEMQLMDILVYQDSPLVKEFFTVELVREKGYVNQAFLYYAREKNRPDFAKLLAKQSNKIEFFERFTLSLGIDETTYTKQIYNDYAVVDSLLSNLNQRELQIFARSYNGTYLCEAAKAKLK